MIADLIGLLVTLVLLAVLALLATPFVGLTVWVVRRYRNRQARHVRVDSRKNEVVEWTRRCVVCGHCGPSLTQKRG